MPWGQLSTKQRRKLKEHLLTDLVARQQGWSKAQELEAIVGARAPVELRDLLAQMQEAHALD